ncbi:hypothetical protein [Conchiformibius kuhniae]|uniref:Uncharacterized protein n=1 Tax=Conchiformibius kuhniae TaxID=211502 RepID=A0A8T9MY62_9NEIS|nr:hypothetical protein [Conchiformibius kuhniae]UOP05356.1 hypothetical protein LVJ77_03940 [Conchiformibius kuhniae]
MAKNTQNQTHIIGLKKDIVDEQTGAPAGYHVINDLHIGYGSAYATATLASYYSQKLHEAGKQPMGSTTVTLYGTPPRGTDVQDWAYRSIAAETAPDALDPYGNPVQPHQFSGADLVFAPADAGTEAG